MAKIRWIRIFITISIVLYLDQIMSNLISYNQRKIYNLNNNTIEPLHDVIFELWIPENNIPYMEIFSLLQVVDIFTWSWCIMTLFLWLIWKRNPYVISNMVMCQIIIIPFFAISQWFTIIPDSLPDCLHIMDIPEADSSSWIWTRISNRSCGNMLWSSDIAQIIIFIHMLKNIFKRECCVKSCKKCSSLFILFLGYIWMSIIIGIALGARYQYSNNIFLTVMVTNVIVTHPLVPKLGEFLFIKHRNIYRERLNEQETERLTTGIQIEKRSI